MTRLSEAHVDVPKQIKEEVNKAFMEDIEKKVIEHYAPSRLSEEREKEIRDLRADNWFVDNPNGSDVNEAVDELFAEIDALREARDYFKGEFHFYHKACNDQDVEIEKLREENRELRDLIKFCRSWEFAHMHGGKEAREVLEKWK